ncbi:MAG: UDP-galactopyranose mutase [Eubacteriales bacterium]|nr:UDP-galactopyranose mutase [Eubacteriales bacterium]
MAKNYDYLIVGAGLFGATFAERMSQAGKRCLVIDKKNHIAGNCHTEKHGEIDVHVYGAHIFHTYSRAIWDYVNSFVEFNRFTNSPIANYNGEIYNLPFNMNTFHALWGVRTPLEAQAKIEQQRAEIRSEATNLEEQAIKLVGRDIYEKLIRGYTEKQWGRPCTELPAFIIRRLPVRFTYDNNYFNDPHQGIPTKGYDALVAAMLENCDLELNCDFFERRSELEALADRIVYTGPIDAYYDYCYQTLEWRSLEFETEVINVENYQGVAVVNYTDRETPFTRIIEHKHFNPCEQDDTVITREFPRDWELGLDPYYPVNDEANMEKFKLYKERADREERVLFGGRLAQYQYYNMDQVISEALQMAARELSRAEFDD